MKKVTVSVRPLAHFEGLELPTYETVGSAGMDVRAAVPEDDPRLVFLPLAQSNAQRYLYLVSQPRRLLSPAAQAFLAVLAAEQAGR